MATGSIVGSDKRLKPVRILDVANSAVDHNSTDAMTETASK